MEATKASINEELNSNALVCKNTWQKNCLPKWQSNIANICVLRLLIEREFHFSYYNKDWAIDYQDIMPTIQVYKKL